MLKKEWKKKGVNWRNMLTGIIFLVLALSLLMFMTSCNGHVNYKILSQERIVGKLECDDSGTACGCKLCLPRDNSEYDCFPLNNVDSLDQLVVLHLGWYIKLIEELNFCYEKLGVE